MWSGSKTFGATLAMHPPSNIPEPNTPSSLLSSTHVHVADHLHLCALWAPRFDKRASPQLSQGRSPDQQHRLWPTRTAILFWSPSCAWRSCCLSLVSCKLANGNTSCVVQQQRAQTQESYASIKHMVDHVAPKEVSTCSYTCRGKRGGKDSAPANHYICPPPRFSDSEKKRRRPPARNLRIDSATVPSWIIRQHTIYRVVETSIFQAFFFWFCHMTSQGHYQALFRSIKPKYKNFVNSLYGVLNVVEK